MGEIVLDIFIWHFVEAPRAIIKALAGILYFDLEYFSVPTLLKTFFSHWRKYFYSYGKRFDLKQYFETFTFNLISRIMGALFRTFFLVLGFLSEFLILTAGIVILVFWIVLPFISVYLFIFGFKLFF